VVRAWDDVLEAFEGAESGRMGEPGPDEDVFVGKRENGTAVQVAHRGIESPGGQRPTGERRHADQQAGSAAYPLEGCKRVAEELGLFANLSDKYPVLALLGQETHSPTTGFRRGQVGHFGKFRISECRTVLRGDLDLHGHDSLMLPYVALTCRPARPGTRLRPRLADSGRSWRRRTPNAPGCARTSRLGPPTVYGIQPMTCQVVFYRPLTARRQTCLGAPSGHPLAHREG